MAFLSVYSSWIAPAAAWCDNLYIGRYEKDYSVEYRPSFMGRLEAEALGRVVCLGAIATGVVLITADVAFTALIGVGALACAVPQTRCLYKTFLGWRKSAEIEVIFLMAMIVSVSSLARSLYGNHEDKDKTPASLSSLLKLSQEDFEAGKLEAPIYYSRTDAITQLFFSSLFVNPFCFACGCIAVLSNVITLGYFRKMADCLLTKGSSWSLLCPVDLAFQALSCFIHLANPRRPFALNFELKDKMAGVSSTQHFLCSRFKRPWDCKTACVYFNNGLDSVEEIRNGLYGALLRKIFTTQIVLISKNHEGTFAIKKSQVDWIKVVTTEIYSPFVTMTQTRKTLLSGEDIGLHRDPKGFFVSDNKQYAVLGADFDGNFILNGGATPIDKKGSDMLQIPLEK